LLNETNQRDNNDGGTLFFPRERASRPLLFFQPHRLFPLLWKRRETFFPSRKMVERATLTSRSIPSFQRLPIRTCPLPFFSRRNVFSPQEEKGKVFLLPTSVKTGDVPWAKEAIGQRDPFPSSVRLFWKKPLSRIFLATTGIFTPSI